MIFVITDTHFGHANMVPYCGRPENFDEVISENWKKVVKPEDTVIHLGDVIFGQNKEQRLNTILASLPGKKILCRGNHDPKTREFYMANGFDFVVDSFVYDDIAFSHCPLTPLPKQNNFNWSKEVSLNIHGHFHDKFPTTEDLVHNELYDVSFFLNHKDKYFHAGIENKLRPYSLEELVERWKGGENK